MTNYEWLLNMGGEERQAWFDADHVDDNGAVRSSDGVIAELTAERDELKAMNERLQVALDAVEGCDERCLKLESERDEWKAKAKSILNAESYKFASEPDAESYIDCEKAENDSREKLEADIEEYLACEYGCIPGIVAVYPDWLDRQAAITRATESHGWRMAASGPIYEYRQERDRLQAKLDELTAERDTLASDLAECDESRIELKDRCERAEKALVEMERERDYWELHTDCWADKCKEAEAERDELRERLSKALGHAHEIGRLVDLEGVCDGR